ncbi:MAG: response regulator [Nitrospirae bacterium]|nr:response regulator [Nitrospirota bacterium]
MEENEKGLPKKILIVEDNQDSRELIVKILKNRGYQLIEAVDGEDALEKAITESPDLILMDISIPKIDGYEVTRMLKSRKEFKYTPIIALTAHAMKGDREKAMESGCEGYIAKPINIHELPEQIKPYLKEK